MKGIQVFRYHFPLKQFYHVFYKVRNTSYSKLSLAMNPWLRGFFPTLTGGGNVVIIETVLSWPVL